MDLQQSSRRRVAAELVVIRVARCAVGWNLSVQAFCEDLFFLDGDSAKDAALTLAARLVSAGCSVDLELALDRAAGCARRPVECKLE